MQADELIFAGVARQAEALRRGDVKAPDLTELYLGRIERFNAQLNAFNDVFAESARADAASAQQRLDRGETAPLLGVPIAVKDNMDIAGHVTGMGTGAFTQPAPADAEIVKRLRAAGAVILGTTTLPEFAMFAHFTASLTEGVTRNPWDTERAPGGSSGGSASAVAAGLVGAALASDGGGSIRVPAAHCGLFGLKPQRGRVSLMPLAEHWYGLTVFGSLTRTVEDSALMLDVLSGPASGDEHVAQAPPQPFVSYVNAEAPKLRIALSAKSTLPGVFLKKPVRRALEETAEALRELGHEVTEVKPNYPFLLFLILARYLRGSADDAAAAQQPERFEKRTKTAIKVAGRFSDNRLRHSLDREQHVRDQLAPIFDHYDVLLTPMIAQPPARADKWLKKGWFSTFNGGSPYVAYSAVWNYTGQPAASVPAGFDADGLPLAVQLIGRTDGEATLISLAAQLERVRPWADRVPQQFAATPQ